MHHHTGVVKIAGSLVNMVGIDNALKTAQMNPHNRIILINGLQLTENAIDYNVGVQIKKTYEIKDLDNDFFEDL